MTGRELIDFIQSNGQEDFEIMIYRRSWTLDHLSCDNIEIDYEERKIFL